MRPNCFALRTALEWRRLAALWLALTALALAACGGSPAQPPQASPPASIALQPSDQSATVGADVTFTVSVANASNPNYRWQTRVGGNWTDIVGATSASYTVSGVTLAQDGTQYRAVVSVAGSALISVPVTLSVRPAPQAPTIAVQPSSVGVTEPASARFDVTASGTAPLAYQWQRNVAGLWTDLAGATAASHALAATLRTADDGAQFRVVVSNGVGSVTSNVATLTVAPAPVVPAFTAQPLDAAVTEPAAATFGVAVTGTPAPTLQWQRSSDGGTNWSDIGGATAASFTTPATTLAMNGWRYRALASNSAGSVASSVATLSVTAATTAPAIAQQPALAVTAASGSGASLSVSATGSPTPTYQWQRQPPGGGGFVNVTGATQASHTTAALSFLDDDDATDRGAQYRVVVTNSQGSVTSNAATLTVTPTPIAGFTQISAGAVHVLGLRSDGTVWAWGSNGSGQVGRNCQPCVPRPVAGLAGGFTQVLARGDTSFAVRNDGTVWAWGYNGDGQLGRNLAAGTNSNVPAPVLMASNGQPLAGIVGVAATEAGGFGGMGSVLAWTASGVAWKWGHAFIEPGLGGFPNTRLLAALPHAHFNGSTPARSIARAAAGGNGTVLAIDGAGTPVFWTSNFGGSSFGTTPVTSFASIGFAGSAIDIAVSDTRVVLVRSDGTAWGQAYATSLVGGVIWNSLNLPIVPLSAPEPVVRAAVGRLGALSALVGASGTVYTAGNNDLGQLGSGTFSSSRAGFAAALVVNDAGAVAVSSDSVLALRNGNAGLWVWGSNQQRTAGTSDSAGRPAGSTGWLPVEATPYPMTGR